MVLFIASFIFVGYVASYSKGENMTAVLLGGEEGRTETYPCELAIGDIGPSPGIGAAVLNGQIIYCGGQTNGWLRNCYKNEGMDWVEIASMEMGNAYFSMITIEDKIIVVGGEPSPATYHMQMFDGSSWTVLPFELKTHKIEHCAVPLRERRLLVIGGIYEDKPPTYLSSVEMYDLDIGFIQYLQPLPVGRSSMGCAMYEDEIWVAGGWVAGGFEAVTLVEIMNIGTNTWRTGPKFHRPREWVTMELLGNDLVLVGDGNTMEIFNGTEWREETLKYSHTWPALVKLPCL